MKALCLLALAVALTPLFGCTENPEYRQPSASDSTADLVALLAQKESSNKYMLAGRKFAAIDILRTRGDEALPVLVRTAQDESEDETVRFTAIEAIGNIDKVPADQIPVLLKMARGPSGGLLTPVIDRSCKAAKKDFVVPLLVDFVKDSGIDYQERQFVALTLLDIDEPAAVAAGVVKRTNSYLPNTKFMPDIKPAK